MATDLPILRCVLFESHTANLKSLTHTASYSRFRLAKRDAYDAPFFTLTVLTFVAQFARARAEKVCVDGVRRRCVS